MSWQIARECPPLSIGPLARRAGTIRPNHFRLMSRAYDPGGCSTREGHVGPSGDGPKVLEGICHTKDVPSTC